MQVSVAPSLNIPSVKCTRRAHLLWSHALHFFDGRVSSPLSVKPHLKHPRYTHNWIKQFEHLTPHTPVSKINCPEVLVSRRGASVLMVHRYGSLFAQDGPDKWWYLHLFSHVRARVCLAFGVNFDSSGKRRWATGFLTWQRDAEKAPAVACGNGPTPQLHSPHVVKRIVVAAGWCTGSLFARRKSRRRRSWTCWNGDGIRNFITFRSIPGIDGNKFWLREITSRWRGHGFGFNCSPKRWDFHNRTDQRRCVIRTNNSNHNLSTTLKTL